MSLSERKHSGDILVTRYSSIGALFILFYSVMSAVKEVVVGHVVQNIDPNFLVFVSFGFVLLIFNTDVIYNFRSFKNGWSIFAKGLRQIILLNVETALAWGCFFWAVRYLEPAVVSAIMVGISPLFSLLLGTERDNDRNLKIRVFCSSLATLFLLLSTYLGFSAVGGISLSSFFTGTILCGFGGASIALVTSRSRRLYQEGYTAFNLMRTRFLLIVLISSASFFIHSDFKAEFHSFTLGGVIGLFGISIPVFALQKGLERCSSTIALLIIACGPAFTWVFQLFDNRLHYSASTIVAIAALFFIACWNILSEQMNAKGKE